MATRPGSGSKDKLPVMTILIVAALSFTLAAVGTHQMEVSGTYIEFHFP